MRAQILAGLRRETTNPNSIASRTWWKTAFPDHPYGRPTNGTLESVPTITADDLQGLRAARAHARQPEDRRGRRHRRRDARRRCSTACSARCRRTASCRRCRPCRCAASAAASWSSSTCRSRWCSFGGAGIARKDPDFMPAYRGQPHPRRRLVLLAALQRGAREARPRLRRLLLSAAARPQRAVHGRHRRPAPTAPARRSS